MIIEIGAIFNRDQQTNPVRLEKEKERKKLTKVSIIKAMKLIKFQTKTKKRKHSFVI